MRETVIIGGARTAFGKFGGMFKDVKAVELGATALNGAIKKAAIDDASVEGVIMGMALQAGAGQLPSRQATRLAGLDWSIPSETINKVCASGIRAITLADQIIRAGDANILLAGGMESMSSAPYSIPNARWGNRMGNKELTDLMLYDGLQCAFAHVPMVEHGDRVAAEYGISRAAQDEWALRSHSLAISAMQRGLFAEEIVPFTAALSQIVQDECPRADTNAGKLATLPPVGKKGGTITAGNAPGVNDGAAAMVLMSGDEAAKRGIRPMARIIGHAVIGTEAAYIATAPALAIRKLIYQKGIKLADIQLFEVNEAFSAVVLTCENMLGWDPKKVNVNGGAIALGHPLGASGARIVLTLIHELMRRGGGLGIAAICSGGAQGDALLIRVDG